MPKLIKKRADKPEEVETEEEVRNYIAELRGKASERSNNVLIAVVAALVIAGGVFGWNFYQKSQLKKAASYEYDGYKLYHGLYDKQGAVKSQRYQEALEAFKKAQGIRKSASNAYYIGAVSFAMGKYQDALASFEGVLRDYPADQKFAPLAMYRIAATKLRMGNKEEALKQFDKIFVESPSFKDVALAESAQILLGQGRPKEALSKYQEIVKSFPDSPYADQAKSLLEKAGMLSNTPAASVGNAPAAAAPAQPAAAVKK